MINPVISALGRLLCGAVLALVPAGCARMDDGQFVPNSLPFRGERRGVSSDDLVVYSVASGYDSLRQCDVLEYLASNNEKQAQQTQYAGITHLKDRGFAFNDLDWANFPLSHYSGLQRAVLMPVIGGFSDTTFRDIYDLYYKDSIVIAVHSWFPKEAVLHRVVIPRPDSQYLVPLALWHHPSNQHWLLAFRISNRIVGIRPVPDTLCFLDLDSGRIVARRPVGAKYDRADILQSDSLLILDAGNPNNGLAFGGFDDRHSYQVAHRLSDNADIAWADTLPDTRNSHPGISYVNTGGNVLIIGPPAPSGLRGIIVRHAVSRDTLAHAVLHLDLQTVTGSTVHPNGRREYYLIDAKGTLRAFDSAFDTRSSRSARLDFVPGVPELPVSIENEQSHFQIGEQFVDVNGDSVNDFLMSSVAGQLITIDGATLEPLSASRVYGKLLRFGFMRGKGGTGVVVQTSNSVELSELVRTPTWDRIWVHRDRIAIALVLLIGLPAGIYIRIQRARIRAAQRQRDALESSIKIVHDAKTPLQTAQLTLDSMISDLSVPAARYYPGKLNEQRATITSAITEALDSINRSVYLAQTMIQPAVALPMNLRTAVEQWMDKVGSRYGSRGFRVNNLVPHDLPAVGLHRIGFHFFLQCACDNAVQWTPHDRTDKAVTIGGQLSGNTVSLSVADNGIGMDPKILWRALHAPGFSTRDMGSGLGLLIIHKSCAEHGARLSIQSSPGAGTTLRMDLPLRTEYS